MKICLLICSTLLLLHCTRMDATRELGKGVQLYKSGEMRESIKALSNVLAVNDTCFQAHLYRGFAYKKLKDYDNALKDFNALININKNSPAGFANRASVFYQLNDYSNALSDFQAAFQLDTTQTILCNPLCHMLFANERKEEACYYYARCMAQGDTTFNDSIRAYCNKQKNGVKK